MENSYEYEDNGEAGIANQFDAEPSRTYLTPLYMRQRAKAYYDKNKAYIRQRNARMQVHAINREDQALRTKELTNYLTAHAGNMAWYNQIRVGILAGSSTCKLLPEEKDKWWSIFMARTELRYQASGEQ